MIAKAVDVDGEVGGGYLPWGRGKEWVGCPIQVLSDGPERLVPGGARDQVPLEVATGVDRRAGRGQ